MSTFVKSKMLLVKAGTTHTGSIVLIEFRNSDYRDKPEDRGYYHRHLMEIGDWENIGSPDQITVTIEPGDSLND